MNCEQLQDRLDNYLDGDLPRTQRDRFEAHLDECEDCRERVSQARSIQEILREIPVPPMRPGFAAQAIRRATEHHSHHRRGFIAGFSTAVAASVLLALFVGKMLPEMESSPTLDTTPPVVISMEHPQTVNLVFDVTTAMEDATLSIELPENVEVVGFPGQHVITWKTSLQPGKNILPLPLKGIMHSRSDLVASVELGGRKKSIRIPIRVDGGEASSRIQPVGPPVA